MPLSCEATNKAGTEYVMQAATFLGPEQYFLEPWTPPASKSEALEERNRQHAVDFIEEAPTKHTPGPWWEKDSEK